MVLKPEGEVIQGFLDALALSLIGKRYASFEGAEAAEIPGKGSARLYELGNEVLAWMRTAM